MSGFNVTTRIHVWLGQTSQSREEFARYFAIDAAAREQDRGASQLDKDLRISWYEEDLLGVYYSELDNRLEAAIDELPTSPETARQVQARCVALGIAAANAMFYYEDAELIIAEQARTYNGLTYLGCFDNP